jgi:hypothetical protein
MTLRLASLFLLLTLCCFGVSAQSAIQPALSPIPAKAAPQLTATTPENDPPSTSDKSAEAARAGKTETSDPARTQFRVERIPVAGGAELLTIFGRLDGLRSSGSLGPEVPLVSVVRDTLSDEDPENDRLRYVWMLTYTRPTLTKRLASGVPFLYQPIGNQARASKGAPRPILDLANASHRTWNHFFWTGLQNVLLDTYGIPLKAASRTYRRNAEDYRTDHVFQALSILDSYEKLRQRSRSEDDLLALRAVPGDIRSDRESINDTSSPLLPDLSPAFSPSEMLEIRARLILSENAFGGLLGPDAFHRAVIKRTMWSVDHSGHNWELLRQRTEAEGLYFEPLKMPDGAATHAMVWIAKPDLAAQTDRDFHGRFLNISNPWRDRRLHEWRGYSKPVFFDHENRIVDAASPGARRVEMIPLALYGLGHPKIPALLIDFRDGLNPKKREVSRRVFEDLAKNIFSLSSFGNIPYFLGRNVYDFVTGRRGMDLNQPTRLRSYSELKLMLSFNSTIDPNLRREIERRIQNVSLNPLNNDADAEVQIAHQQYEALMNYARQAEGLTARIERDRRAEMVPLKHGRTARFFYTLGNVLSFGRYVHREDASPELYRRLENARRVSYHARFLDEVVKSSPQAEVAWDIAMVKRSLSFLAEHSKEGTSAGAKAASGIFQKSSDDETRRLSLEALSNINNNTARKELLKLFQQQQNDSAWRLEIATRLRQAVIEDSSIKPAEAKALLAPLGAP